MKQAVRTASVVVMTFAAAIAGLPDIALGADG